jgi:hypothetical protein
MTAWLPFPPQNESYETALATEAVAPQQIDNLEDELLERIDEAEEEARDG